MEKIDKFIRERKKMNDLIFKRANLEIKRFFNIDKGGKKC